MMKKTCVNSKPDNQRNLEIKDIYSFIRAFKGKIQKLHDTAARIPKVDSKGHSECPFAERLYAEKEVLLQEFRSKRSDLQGYMILVDQEVTLFINNLNQLQSDTSSFNTTQTKERIKTARHNYQFHYNKYLNIKQELAALASQSNEVIRIAEANKWPVGTPQNKSPFPMVHLETTGHVPKLHQVEAKLPMQPNTDSTTRSEVDNLFSLGPMTHAGFTDTTP